jgi:glycosyltransferase involved in cell wall biosynthesis
MGMRKSYGEPLIAEPPDRCMQACIVLPAKNEEELLPSALQALTEQKMLQGAALPHAFYEILLLINNSTDRSSLVAKSFQRLYPTLRLHVIEREFEPSQAHIGHVRRLLMDEAFARLEWLGLSSGLILSTDSDSRVAPNWICRNLEEIDKGAEAVGGRIVVLPCEQASLDAATQSSYRYDHLYARLVCWVEDRWDPQPHDRWPRHHHHFGASLAIRPQAYKRAGRLPPRRFLEDLAFYDALLRSDIRLRHANTVRVFTSARLKGRTRFGLSRQLNEWQQGGRGAHHVRVESARFLEHLFQTRNRLRQVWTLYRTGEEPLTGAVQEISSALGLPPRTLTEVTRQAQFFGALLFDLKFYQRCRAGWPEWVRLARLTDAVDELTAAFEAARRSSPRYAQIAAGRK